MSEELDMEHLYNQYHRDIYQFALYFTNSIQDAEDITQDTFIKAMRNVKTIQDTSRIKFWLLSIARHTAIDHIRKKKFSKLIPDFFEKLIASDKSLDEQVVAKEKWEEIQKTLLKLKPHYRSLLILRGIQELTTKETADILGCTELKVRVDFHRAVKQLKKYVSDTEGEVQISEQGRKIHPGN
ncbi:RNA polymerase sigma factor YlaC [Bacillus carboniphilus]|uniref:RNA polymerase sigma factor YlaC n=1 Tax=Bacillus carboniphilus TaxID=86663 RepID=A0ABN0VV72_9BACI